MMMMNMMMKIKMVITWLIFELGAPNFAWKQIYIIPSDDDNDHGDDDDNYDDDEHDDEDNDGHNSANFQTRSFRFCMVIDPDNTQ